MSTFGDALVGANIRTAREALGLSQDALASLMADAGHPWHQTTVSPVERGARPLRFLEALDVAHILGIDNPADLACPDLVPDPYSTTRVAAELRDAAESLIRLARGIETR